MGRQKPPIHTAYGLAKASKGLITGSTAQRLLSEEHPPKGVDFSTLDALCDTLKCKPSELLTRD